MDVGVLSSNHLNIVSRLILFVCVNSRFYVIASAVRNNWHQNSKISIVWVIEYLLGVNFQDCCCNLASRTHWEDLWAWIKKTRTFFMKELSNLNSKLYLLYYYHHFQATQSCIKILLSGGASLINIFSQNWKDLCLRIWSFEAAGTLGCHSANLEVSN